MKSTDYNINWYLQKNNSGYILSTDRCFEFDNGKPIYKFMQYIVLNFEKKEDEFVAQVLSKKGKEELVLDVKKASAYFSKKIPLPFSVDIEVAKVMFNELNLTDWTEDEKEMRKELFSSAEQWAKDEETIEQNKLDLACMHKNAFFYFGNSYLIEEVACRDD